MKIGDKVRFISEKGGGVVVGFQSGNIAMVEDEDGFQVPTQVSDLVVVNEDRQAKALAGGNPQTTVDVHTGIQPAGHSAKPQSGIRHEAPAPVHVYERENSDKINLYLGFVPKDKKNISKSEFYVYVINDCNFFISFTYSLLDGADYKLLAHNVLEPNTKLLIAKLKLDDVADYQNGAMQINAYKTDRPFKLQPSMDVKLRVDPVKFYKLHTFRENDFFDDDALVMPVVENGVPMKTLSVEADDLKEKMLEKQRIDITAPARTSDKRNGNDPLVVDLHIGELLDSTAGMSHTEILEYQLGKFKETLDAFKDRKGFKIIFIHGKGEGVLRNAIIKELRYRYKKYTYQDASFQEYGYGATQVTIH